MRIRKNYDYPCFGRRHTKKKSSNERTLEQKKNWQLPIFAKTIVGV